MRNIICLALLMVVWVPPSFAATTCDKVSTTYTCHTAEDCGAANIQSTIDEATAGDTIDMTYEGTIDWGQRVIVTGGITLKGPGSKTGDYTTDTGSWPLTINSTYSNTGATDGLIRIVNDDNQKVNRVTGFKFTASANNANAFISTIGKGVGEDSKGAFRIDNNYAVVANASTISRIVYFNGHQGKLSGVIDHNVFGASAEYTYISYYNEQVGSSPDDRCYGYPSYARPIGFGTNDFFFIEDNYFTNLKVAASGGGGRIVVRYNTLTGAVNGSGFVDAHPMGTIGWHATGAVGGEIYKNIITHTNLSNAIDLRGGKWRVWGNVAASGRIQLRLERVTAPGLLEWKACSGAHCCPSIHAEAPTCDIQSPTDANYAACHPLAAQIQNTYLWNNKMAGGSDMPIYRDTETYIAPNVDYWVATTGTTLPGTCTTGSGFWATDTNTMYKCTATDTWTASYAPYTYPHPLRTDAPADETAPTNTEAGNSISADGLTLTLNHTESITKTGDGTIVVTCDGEAAAQSYTSGSGTANLVYTFGAAVTQGQVCTASYTQGGNDLEDAAGNDLATYSGHTIVNGSTVSSGGDTFELSVAVVGGGKVNSSQGGIQCTRDNTPCTKTVDDGTVITFTLVPYNGHNAGVITGTGCGTTTTMSEARSCTVTFPAIYLLN